MPELPEVETTRRGILGALRQRGIAELVVREPRLRWPVDRDLAERLRGETVLDIERRGKYLLWRLQGGTLLVHLGMSGSLRFVMSASEPPRKHDHVDIVMCGGQILRYHDPRRFGAFLWAQGDPLEHSLLRNLGPEPLQADFDGDYLYRVSRGRRASIKQFLMDGCVVVGVGNIYASEALFRAGINPRRQAGRVALARYRALAGAVRQVLNEAIEQGGTTLRDYVNSGGETGYFSLKLFVYGRKGEPCRHCGGPIEALTIGQRNTFFCPACQR